MNEITDTSPQSNTMASRKIFKFVLYSAIVLVVAAAILPRIYKRGGEITPENLYDFATSHDMIDDRFSLAVNDVASSLIGESRFVDRAIRINEPFSINDLNIYVLKNIKSSARIGSVNCNCISIPRFNSIVCDSNMVDAFLNSFEPRESEDNTESGDKEKKDIMQAFSNTRSSALLSWLIGHEIGHVSLRHDLTSAGFMGIRSHSIKGDDPNEKTQNKSSSLKNTKKSLFDLEKEADNFVIDNLDENGLSNLPLSTYNFSGVAAEILNRDKTTGGSQDIIVRYNPKFHPDLDYRAITMTIRALEKMGKEDEYYTRLYKKYHLDEKAQLTQTSCQVIEGLQKTHSWRRDVDNIEKANMKFLYTIFAHYLPAESDARALDRARSDILITESSSGLLMNDLIWIKIWLDSVDGDNRPWKIGGGQRLVEKLRDQIRLSQTKGIPVGLLPAVIRLASIYTKALSGKGNIISKGDFRSVSAFFSASKSPDVSRFITQQVINALNNRNPDTDNELLDAAIVYEAINFFGNLDGQFLSSFADDNLFFSVSKAVLKRKRDMEKANYIISRAVHSSALQYRTPNIFLDASKQKIANMIQLKQHSESSIALDFERLTNWSDLLKSAIDSRSKAAVQGILLILENQCGTRRLLTCPVMDWPRLQFAALTLLDSVVAPVEMLSRNPGVFLELVNENFESVLYLENLMQANEQVHPKWVALLGSINPLDIRDPRTRASWYCMKVAGLASIGQTSVESASACEAEVKNLDRSACDPGQISLTQASTCLNMRFALLEHDELIGDYNRARMQMDSASQLIAIVQPDTDIGTIKLYHNHKILSWSEFAAMISSSIEK